MGKDRRKKETGKKQTTPSVTSEDNSEPKGQREPRNRAHQREPSKSTEPSVKKDVVDGTPIPKKEPVPEPANTAELFANLKRETDDIKALTTKKFAKRQIFSNWERYDEPLPEPQYEAEMQGADFESLVNAPSTGGLFQLKSERTWDANVSALSGELFSLDIDLLAGGLATIPLYTKLDVPVSVFSAELIDDMDSTTSLAIREYESTRKNLQKTHKKSKDVKQTSPTKVLLDILLDKEQSPLPEENSESNDKSVLNFDLDQTEDQNEPDNVNTIEEEPIQNSYNNQQNTSKQKKVVRQESPPKASLKATENRSTIETKDKVEQSLDRNNQVLASQESRLEEVLSPKENEVEFTSVRETVPESTSLEMSTEILPPRGARGEMIGSKEIKKEVTPVREIVKENTPVKEIKQKSTDKSPQPQEIKVETPKQEIQQLPDAESPDNLLQEPTEPLGQRSSRRKGRGQPPPTESQKLVPESKVETQPQPQPKPEGRQQQSEDDLDFLLSLKKPVRQSQIPASQPSQVAKPSIEEDDSSQLTLVNPQKKTEDLEDWLDSMLDD